MTPFERKKDESTFIFSIIPEAAELHTCANGKGIKEPREHPTGLGDYQKGLGSSWENWSGAKYVRENIGRGQGSAGEFSTFSPNPNQDVSNLRALSFRQLFVFPHPASALGVHYFKSHGAIKFKWNYTALSVKRNSYFTRQCHTILDPQLMQSCHTDTKLQFNQYEEY